MRRAAVKDLKFIGGVIAATCLLACGSAPGGDSMGGGGTGTGGTSAGSGGTGSGGASTGTGGTSTGAGGGTAGGGGTSTGAGGTSTGIGGGTAGNGSGGASGSGSGGSSAGSGGRGGGNAGRGGNGGGTGGAAAGSSGTGGRGGGAGTGTAGTGVAGTGGSTGAAGSGAAVPSAGCGKTRTLQNGRITIQSNGSRTYILRVPDNYDSNHPYRLIMAYHWLGGTAANVADGGNWATDTPYYGLWNLANSSTIFVAPEGLGSGANTGWPNTNGQDVALTDAILAQIEGDLCIDTSRIFANGFSYGAGMSYAIACARANVFRGVALYSGAQLSGCSGGTTPIAYIGTHGTNDGTLNISGGRTLKEHYRTVNGCSATSTAVTPTTHCVAYQGCSAGHPVTWCEFNGDHNPSPKDSGQTTSWVPQTVWSFFSQF